MAISDYGELKARIIRWAARGDLGDVVEDFIRYPHDLIVENLVLTTDIILLGGSVSLPSDCAQVVAVWPVQGAAAPLRALASAEMTSPGSGAPLGYRVSAGKLFLGPAASDSYAARLQYRLKPDFFDVEDDDDSNTVLQRYPYLYLHGALAEFGRFDKDQATEQTYESRFQDALQLAINAEQARATQGLTLQTRSGVVV